MFDAIDSYLYQTSLVALVGLIALFLSLGFWLLNWHLKHDSVAGDCFGELSEFLQVVAMFNFVFGFVWWLWGV